MTSGTVKISVPKVGYVYIQADGTTDQWFSTDYDQPLTVGDAVTFTEKISQKDPSKKQAIDVKKVQ